MADATDDDSGLLGNLPNRRPGVESPRRVAARKAAARRKGADAAAAAPPADPGEGPGPAQESGLEQLARAGAGLGLGIATAGLRIAGRAAGEIGKVVGRR